MRESKLDLLTHANFIEFDVIHESRQLFNQIVFVYVPRRALSIIRFTAPIVDVAMCVSVLLSLVLFVGSNPRPTQFAGNELCEGKLFSLHASTSGILHLYLFLYLIEESFAYQWFMSTLIPVTAILWILECPVVKMIAENQIQIT